MNLNELRFKKEGISNALVGGTPPTNHQPTIFFSLLHVLHWSISGEKTGTTRLRLVLFARIRNPPSITKLLEQSACTRIRTDKVILSKGVVEPFHCCGLESESFIFLSINKLRIKPNHNFPFPHPSTIFPPK